MEQENGNKNQATPPSLPPSHIHLLHDGNVSELRQEPAVDSRQVVDMVDAEAVLQRSLIPISGVFRVQPRLRGGIHVTLYKKNAEECRRRYRRRNCSGIQTDRVYGHDRHSGCPSAQSELHCRSFERKAPKLRPYTGDDV